MNKQHTQGINNLKNGSLEYKDQKGQVIKQEVKLITEEMHVTEASQILENPPDGSFLLGLKTFVNWVNQLLAKKD